MKDKSIIPCLIKQKKKSAIKITIEHIFLEKQHKSDCINTDHSERQKATPFIIT